MSDTASQRESAQRAEGSPCDRPAPQAAPKTAVACLQQVIDFFETLSPATLAQLDRIYAPTARFKDPFNDVIGLEPIASIFEAMFRDLDAPRFVVTAVTGDARQACLLWEFHFQTPRIGRGTPQCIHGSSWIELDAGGRIARHRDYWDAAEELYEKLPVVGALMRWRKPRLAHASAGAGVTTD